MSTRKYLKPRRRFQTRKVMTAVKDIWIKRNADIKDDLRKYGFEFAKTGVLGIVLNAFVRNSVLFAMSVTLFILGLIFWIYGFTDPVEQDKNPPDD